MSSRPVFLRPIYFGETGPHFSYGGTDVTLDTGVYGSILTLLKEMETKIKVVDSEFSITFTGDFFILMTCDTTTAISAYHSSTWDILGFTGNLTGQTNYTGTYTPSHQWWPTYQQANQGEFQLRQQERFSGRTAIDGGISGIKLDGGDLLYKSLNFDFEPAENVSRIFATDAYMKERCLDAFVDGARWSIPDDAGEVSTTGFYYYPDYTSITGLVADMSTLEGTNLYYSSSPDTHTFCHIDPGSIVPPTPALPTGRTVYNVGFTINSATPPTWTATP